VANDRRASKPWDVTNTDGLHWSFGRFFEKAYGICPTRPKHHKNIVPPIMLTIIHDTELRANRFGRPVGKFKGFFDYLVHRQSSIYKGYAPKFGLGRSHR
jgi:hypothetical protein